VKNNSFLNALQFPGELAGYGIRNTGARFYELQNIFVAKTQAKAKYARN